MSHFYGDLQGNRGQASRCGTKESGVNAHVRGWDIGGHVDVCRIAGADVVFFKITGGSNGGVVRTIATARRVDGKIVVQMEENS